MERGRTVIRASSKRHNEFAQDSHGGFRDRLSTFSGSRNIRYRNGRRDHHLIDGTTKVKANPTERFGSARGCCGIEFYMPHLWANDRTRLEALHQMRHETKGPVRSESEAWIVGRVDVRDLKIR
jgi:hypothetical protein